MRLTPTLGENRYGGAQPQIEVRSTKDIKPRAFRACLHTLAARAELESPAQERWFVQIEVVSDVLGYLYLELMDGTPAEAERGVAFLKAIVGGQGA